MKEEIRAEKLEYGNGLELVIEKDDEGNLYAEARFFSVMDDRKRYANCEGIGVGDTLEEAIRDALIDAGALD